MTPERLAECQRWADRMPDVPNRTLIKEALDHIDTLTAERDALKEAPIGPAEQFIYPCGCISCICESLERCTGCGGRGCGQPGLAWEHIPGGKAQTVGELCAERDALTQRVQALEAERGPIVAQLVELNTAAEDFIQKVESGRARSVDSYNKFKKALAHKPATIQEPPREPKAGLR